MEERHWLLQCCYVIIALPVLLIVGVIYELFTKVRDKSVRRFGVLTEGSVIDVSSYFSDGEDCVKVTYSFKDKDGKTHQGILRECYHALYWAYREGKTNFSWKDLRQIYAQGASCRVYYLWLWSSIYTVEFPNPATRRYGDGSIPELREGTVAHTMLRAKEAEGVYLDALKRQDIERAASVVSEYSLALSDNSRENIIAQLEKKVSEGWRLVDYEIIETRMLDNQLVLMYITTRERVSNNESRDCYYWTVLRQENGQWRINWNRVVDAHTLHVQPQTVNGVTIQPMQMICYAEKVRFVLDIENSNTRGVFWGHAGEKVGAFHFGDRVLDALGDLHIGPECTYPGAYIEARGIYKACPTAVDLLSWRWASRFASKFPEPRGETWCYSVDLRDDTQC
ncbi:MAG: nuclear transport factor 2 family protein [Chloroflexota bacterium]|nr:nuclear transport factor 2 family protein [Chloroflexota bacterium]